MQPFHEISRWFMTPDGRLAAVAVLFALIWMIKSVPWIKSKILKNDRARLIATIITGMAPASIMLMDQSVSAGEAWKNAFLILLGAMGMQGGIKAALGKQLKAKLRMGDEKDQS